MYKMVIADDESAIRQGLKKLVESFELDIAVVGLAADGLEALTFISDEKPQLMLVDINMPRMNGLDLVERARAIVPEGKIIIVSGYDQFDYARRALKLGVYDYLLKPINHAVLQSTLADAIKELGGANNAPPVFEPLSDDDVLDKALEQVHIRYPDDKLRLAVLAEELYVSNAFLSRGFKQRTGKTFSDYLTDLRMQKAQELMQKSKSVMIYSVAEQVGYSSQHYFCRIFKEHTGYTPSEYLRLMKNTQN